MRQIGLHPFGQAFMAARRFWTDLFLAQTIASSSDKHPRLAIDSEGIIVQGFHPSARYEQDPDENVLVMTNSNADNWGVQLRQRVFKHTACILHAPGGPGNYQPMHDILWPRWKQRKNLLYDIGAELE